MTLDMETANNLAGIAALINSLVLVPSVISLRKIVVAVQKLAEGHATRIEDLESASPKHRRRRRTRR